MTAVIVNLLGLLVIALVVWWFWFSRPAARRGGGARPIEITVDNGVYTPARIEVLRGQPVVLRFIRNDPSPCAEKVVFGDFGISDDLVVGRPHDISLIPEKAGEFEFTCQMRMYRGTLVVVDS